MSLPRNKIKTVFLSSLGGGLEFYDFVIFAIFANSIAVTFFPNSSPIAGLIKSYGVFAIGYLIRPIGGIIFSHFGDKYGRKKSFAFSISLMAVSTLLMSITPSFEYWGLWGTLVFILFRMLQGISIGGEIPGAITFVSEHVPQKKGAACAVILLFLNIGILLGDVVNTGLQIVFTPINFNQYGWRIAFLFGGVLALVSFYMRRTLAETDDFLNSAKRYNLPLLALIKYQRIMVLKAFLIAGAAACVVSIFLLFIQTHLKTVLHVDAHSANTASLFQLLAFMFSSFAASWLSDLFGRRKILIIGAIYLIFAMFFVFKLLLHPQINHTLLLSCNAIIIGAYAGVMPCFLSDLFPVEIRYSGIALSYNAGFAIFGGLSPLLATLLIQKLSSPLAPAIIVSGSGVLALGALLFTTPKS